MKISLLRALFALGLLSHALACGDTDPLPTADGGRPDAGRDAGADAAVPNPQLVFTPDPTTLALVEGAGPVSFTITLTEDPKTTINASLAVADPSALVISPTSGALDSANFSTGITVTLTPEDDDDTANDTTTITVTTDVGTETFTVTVIDDDAANIVVVPTQVAMNEGGSAELRVRLSASPDQAVTVNVRATDEPRLGVGSASLSFSAANWNVEQTVALNALEDDDLADNTVDVILDQVSGDTATVAVSISDNDTQAIIVSTSSVTVGEGESEVFTVRLAYAPAADVTVQVAASPLVVATSAPATLTFTPANYATPQDVTVSGVEDDNLTSDSATIDLSATEVPAGASVAVTVVDDDSQQIVVSTSSVTVDENGTTVVGVRLAYEPTVDVTVQIAVSDASHVGLDVTELTFNAGNYDTEQTVTISGQDDADVRDENETLTFSAIGADDVIASVLVNDDDTQAIVTDLASVSVDEGGFATIGVRLAFEPDADTVVSAAALGGAFGVAPGTLTFGPGNYDQFQNLTLGGLQDDDVEDDLDSLELSTPNVAGTSVPVTVLDEDTQAIVASTTGISVPENGTTNFTVRLAFRPAAAVTVAATPADAQIATNPTSLTFDATNWNVAQTVAVSAGDDENVEDETSSVVLSSAGLADVTVAVLIIDSDILNLVVTPDNMTLTEGGQPGTFEVRITQEPSAPTTVTITPSAAGVVNLSATDLVFDANNWTQAQIVTVDPVDDDDALNETVALTVATAGLTPRTVTVFVTDTDVQAILLSTNTLNLQEDTNGNVTVRLQANPVDPATVTITIDDDTAVGASTATLVFTAANWDQEQTVVVSALDDANTRNEVATLTFSSPIAPNAVLTVNVTDPDVQSLILTSNAVTLDEGTNQVVGVRLAFDPVDPVVVNVASSDVNAVGAAPATLTFNSGNYDTNQNVTVTGVQDDDTVDEAETVTLTSAVTAAEVINVAVNDDDTQAIITSVNTLNIGEGAAGNFTVRLAFNPLGAVAVNIATTDGNVAAPNPVVLNFDQNSWATPQQITVNAPQDDDTQDGAATLTLSSAVSANATVDVNVADDDTQAIVVSTNALTVAEGGANSFTVALAFNPLGATTVTLNNPDAGAIGVVPLTINFNAGNYAVPVTVTVNGLADDDALEENVTITLSGAGAPQNETVDVTVNDDDTQAIVVSSNTLTVTEGDQANFTVRLAFNPINPATVTITSDDEGAALPVPVVLNFDNGNYTVPQVVVVNGMADPDLADENVTLTLSSAIAPDVDVDVLVEDDDTQSFIVNPVAVTLDEGGTETFTVRLAFIPPANTNVTLTSNDLAVATVSGPLNFTPGTYDQPQLVTVTGTQDLNLVQNTTTITVASAGIADAIVDVTVNDDDTQSYVIVPTTLGVDEGNLTSFTARLAFEPPTPVVVTVSSDDALAASVGTAVLNFDAGDWATPQTVVVTGEQDNDTRDEAVQITLNSGDVPVDGTVDVAVTDDDEQALVVVPTDVTVDEEGEGNGSFAVSFAFEPDADTDVTITSTDLGAVDVFPITLTFSPGNYNVPQDVTVVGVSDDDVADENVDVEVSTPIAPLEIVNVTVFDDDTQAIVVSTNTVNVTEDTGPGTFTVRLAFRPAAATNVTIVSSNDLAATADPVVLTFQPNQYDQEQTVTVSGTTDQDQFDTSAVLTLSSAGVADVNVDVNVTDDDDQSIIVSANTVFVDEEATTTFTVRLAFEPLQATEIVTLLPDDLGAVTVNPIALVFDATDYDQPQVVTVNGEEDADIRDETVDVSLTSNDGLTPQENVTVNVNDIDIMTIILSANTLDLNEGGQPASITVTLSNEPTGNLVVNVGSQDLGAVTANPISLTFDDTNYTQAQTVNLSPVDDNDVRDETVDVDFTAAAVTTETLVVSVADDDTQSIIIDSEGVGVTEGQTSPFTVRLEFEPTNPVTVTITSDDPTIATVDPISLVFNAGNYTVAQTVDVSGTEDDDLNDENTDLTLSTGGLAAPEGATDVTLGVFVTDDDTQVILVESVPVTLPTSVQEGGPGVAFRVRLQYPPRLIEDGGTDTVDLSSALANVNFTPTSILFGQGDFDTWVDVIVAAEDDGNNTTELDDALLEIVGEVNTTHQVQIVDDEITVLVAADLPELLGGTLFTKRQNVGWGSTRLGVVGFDAVTGQTRIASNTRELDDPVFGPEVSTPGGPFSTESVEFDGTNFGFFVTNGGGIQYVRSDETANASALSVSVVAANALSFWPAWNGTDRFGVAYRISGATSDNLFMRIVRTDGTVSAASQLTVAQGADDETPNVHWNGGGFTVLYSAGTEVRCLRTNAAGTLVAGSDTALTGFPAGGATISSVFDGSFIVAVYYDATNSINLVRINPANCTVSGAHSVVGDSNVFFSAPPTIGYNGTEFAVGYDYLDGLDERTGVLLVTPGLEFRDDYVLPDQGRRPSISWAGDRWAVRYNDATQVKVLVGSFQTHCADGTQDFDEEDVDCGGNDCRACPPQG